MNHATGAVGQLGALEVNIGNITVAVYNLRKKNQILGCVTEYISGMLLFSFKNTVGRMHFWLDTDFDDNSSPAFFCSSKKLLM